MLSSSLRKTKKQGNVFDFFVLHPSCEITVGCNFTVIALDAGKGWNYAIIFFVCCCKGFFVGIAKWLYYIQDLLVL